MGSSKGTWLSSTLTRVTCDGRPLVDVDAVYTLFQGNLSDPEGLDRLVFKDLPWS